MEENATIAPPAVPGCDLGPDLKPLGWREHLEIFLHILKLHGMEIVIMISAILGVVIVLARLERTVPANADPECDLDDFCESLQLGRVA